MLLSASLLKMRSCIFVCSPSYLGSYSTVLRLHCSVISVQMSICGYFNSLLSSLWHNQLRPLSHPRITLIYFTSLLVRLWEVVRSKPVLGDLEDVSRTSSGPTIESHWQ